MATREECPICGGAAEFVREEREHRIGHRRTVVPDEFYRCTECGEEYYTPEQAKAVQERASAKLHAEGQLLLPDEIRAVRERYGLTQPEFERLLGAGRNNASRWETGKVIPNAPTEELIRLIDRDPENARFLARRHGVDLSRAA